MAKSKRCKVATRKKGRGKGPIVHDASGPHALASEINVWPEGPDMDVGRAPQRVLNVKANLIQAQSQLNNALTDIYAERDRMMKLIELQSNLIETSEQILKTAETTRDELDSENMKLKSRNKFLEITNDRQESQINELQDELRVARKELRGMEIKEDAVAMSKEFVENWHKLMEAL